MKSSTRNFYQEIVTAARIHHNSEPNARPSFSTEKCEMNVTITECPTKHVLAVKHRGPYTAVSESFARLDAIARPAGLLNETLGASWSQLMGHWLPQSGQRIAQGPAYERYVNTPQHVPVSE